MSELEKIYEKINDTREDVAYIRGTLDTLIPTLTTAKDVDKMLSNHKKNCNPGVNKKVVAALITLATAVSATITAVVSNL